MKKQEVEGKIRQLMALVKATAEIEASKKAYPYQSAKYESELEFKKRVFSELGYDLGFSPIMLMPSETIAPILTARQYLRHWIRVYEDKRDMDSETRELFLEVLRDITDDKLITSGYRIRLSKDRALQQFFLPISNILMCYDAMKEGEKYGCRHNPYLDLHWGLPIHVLHCGNIEEDLTIWKARTNFMMADRHSDSPAFASVAQAVSYIKNCRNRFWILFLGDTMTCYCSCEVAKNEASEYAMGGDVLTTKYAMSDVEIVIGFPPTEQPLEKE